MRTKNQIAKDNLSLVAAGVAFYALLAIFPTLVASVSLYGIVAENANIMQQFYSLTVLIPVDARSILLDQVEILAKSSEKTLGITFIAGLIFALFSAMKGMKAMIMALNIAYNEQEKRGFLKIHFIAILLTLASVLLMVFLLGLVVAVPVFLQYIPKSEYISTFLTLLRWPVVVLVLTMALSALYHFAPSRKEARWQWVSWGAGIATIIWLLASIGFSVYVENFGNFNKVYGSIGALVILLMWFFISSYALLIGAELNAEMEHQTRHDTTVGKPKPMGERGAFVADTLGESQKR
jgi:membrane protein